MKQKKLPLTIEKPWGNELLFALASKYAGKILTINKGHRLSLQFHNKKEETLYLLKGSIRLSIRDSKGKIRGMIMKPGTVHHLPPKTVHRIAALKYSQILEVSTPELYDVVRMDDDYDRVG